ncbi:MAG: DUF1285 domain-containing protein [Pseudohongiellaceae bacterium]
MQDKRNAVASLDPYSLTRHVSDTGPAPVHLWNPPFCGDMDMRIAADGVWYHEGRPIRRQAMVRLFSSILKREDDEYFLVTPVEKVRIQVEDCPFVAVLMDVEKKGKGKPERERRRARQRLVFTLNTGEQISADANHPIEVTTAVDGQPHPTLHVRNQLRALLGRNVFYALVEMAEVQEVDGRTVSGVRSEGCFFELGNL